MAVHIRKDSGHAYVVYRVDGKIKQEHYGKGPAAVAAAERRNLELGYGKRRRPAAQGSPAFDDLAAAYIKARHFSENSLKHLIIRLGNISPAIGHLSAASITHGEIDRYVDARRKAPVYDRGGHLLRIGVKWSTIAREIADIKAILNLAVERKEIVHNPLAGYKKPRPDYDVIDPPTVNEVQRILAKASPHLYRAIKLSFFTGLRPGAVELLSLTWQRVNFEAGTIRIISADKGGPRVRDVPIHPALVDELRKWHRKDGGRGPIIHYHGHAVQKIWRAWAGTLERAGITRRLRPYDLRHYFVTRALGEGVDIKTVAEVVGSAPATLIKHYQHVARAQHVEAVGKMPDLEIKKPQPERPRL